MIDPLTARCRGVVLIDMRLAVVEEIFEDMTLGRGGFLFIEDRGGGIVYAPVNPVVYRVRDEWLHVAPDQQRSGRSRVPTTRSSR